ncbi:glutamine amidotransferas-like protein class-I [Morchella conica CCBAS932]|uniref:Glutamine amidotransferas-like protein class-I n=1 Tax=Morchella conica CCBAS932 TaxID=1392247 RepID=A0A3N4KQA9_9PEZI|nr:glutamine amidotransferas-like protein class-I [Morchella conica CCBAS932]
MNSKASLRIAVLETGYPPERAAAKYGNYGSLFTRFLEASVAKLATPEFPSLEVTKWDVQKLEQYPSLDDIDAILMSGSASSAFDNAPWIIKLVEFTRMVLIEQTRVRIIGICFGHQIVARALGVKVDRGAQGWEASVLPMQLSPLGKIIFSGRDTLNLHQMHRDIVTELPEGVQLLGSTPVCEIHGMYAPKRLITVQGHPEYNSEIVSEILQLRKSVGLISQDMFEEMMSRVNNKHDGLEFGVAVLKFLNE